tara:strand:- start:94 stop:525 length:432 start_codon:yes stop_codon:yes gene_type:complete
MKTNLKKVYSKLPNQKTNLRAHKIALGLIDNLEYDVDYIDDQSGLLSYLAYEWHDEKFEAARQAWMELNDEYKFNASAVLRFDDVSGDIEKLNEIKEKAEELGLEAYEVYPAYDRHMEAINYMKESDDQFIENEREFNNYFGN